MTIYAIRMYWSGTLSYIPKLNVIYFTIVIFFILKCQVQVITWDYLRAAAR